MPAHSTRESSVQALQASWKKSYDHQLQEYHWKPGINCTCMCNQTWNYGTWLLQSPNLDQGLHQTRWWESCSTGRTWFRLLVHEKPTGPFSTPCNQSMGSATHEVNVQPNQKQRLQSSSERWEWKERDRNCVLEAQHELQPGEVQREAHAHTPWMCNFQQGAASITWCCSAHLSKDCNTRCVGFSTAAKVNCTPQCVWLLTEVLHTQTMRSTQKS